MALNSRIPPTHWTLVERNGYFTKDMMPQNLRSAPFDEQPRVFQYITGTKEQFSAFFKRNTGKYNDESLFSPHPIFEYEKEMARIRERISEKYAIAVSGKKNISVARKCYIFANDRSAKKILKLEHQLQDIQEIRGDLKSELSEETKPSAHREVNTKNDSETESDSELPEVETKTEAKKKISSKKTACVKSEPEEQIIRRIRETFENKERGNSVEPARKAKAKPKKRELDESYIIREAKRLDILEKLKQFKQLQNADSD
ncbi:hypothetical protein PC128_g9429 [Phytophthora cactorum]|nr:hypothetical protein PC128_g9429 [Phytophthora cactorum]